MPSLNPEPEDYARILLSHLERQRVNDLAELLSRLRLTVREADAESFEGSLVCRKDRSKGIIAISNSIKEEGRKRFTICHEVGHFILPGHGKVSCRSIDIETHRKGIPSQEIEANRVASELLLPTKQVYPRVEAKKATMSLAKQLAEEFGTSLTAAALKIVELTPEACALVWSSDGHSRWFKRNDNFFDYLPPGRLDPLTLAAKLFEDNSTRSGEAFVYADAWLHDGSSGRRRIWEDSIFLRNYNAVLTILTLDD